MGDNRRAGIAVPGPFRASFVFQSASVTLRGILEVSSVGGKPSPIAFFPAQPMACWLHPIFSQLSSLWRLPFLPPPGGHVGMDGMVRRSLKPVGSASEGPTVARLNIQPRVCVSKSPPPSSHATCPSDRGSLFSKQCPFLFPWAWQFGRKSLHLSPFPPPPPPLTPPPPRSGL